MVVVCTVQLYCVCTQCKMTVCFFVFFRDRLTGNDAIGTTYLNLSKIASSGGEIEGVYLVKITLIFQLYYFWTY